MILELRAKLRKNRKSSQEEQQMTQKEPLEIRKRVKALPFQGVHKFAAGVGKFGLPLAMAGPMVGGALGQAMYSGDTEDARRGRAGVQGAGTAVSMMGMGAMTGAMFGPKGALAGGIIGGITGGVMGASSYFDEASNLTEEMAKEAAASVDLLNKFNVGTQQTTRAYASYIKALNENTGQISAQEMVREEVH